MRPRALVLASLIPVALAFAPSAATAQRYTFDRCRDRFGDCSFDRDIARRARENARRIRDEVRANARATSAEARAFATAARAQGRLRERPIPAARFRADALRERLRDRFDARRYERRGRNRLSW